MKLYVIKNKKDGKYKTDCGDDCTDLLYANCIEEEYKKYEKLYEDEYWQEVTFAEGDLEKELAIRDKMIEILLKDNIEYEQELIKKGLVEGSVLTDLGYDLTLKSYREEVEKLARKELESKDDI